MNILTFENIEFLDIDVPISTMCIADLPDYTFNPDSWIMRDPWKKCVNKIVRLSYLNLVITNVIQIEYKTKKHKFLMGLINREQTDFIPKLNQLEYSFDKIAWLENIIIASVNSYQNEFDFRNKHFLNRQIRSMVNSIFGKDHYYCNPWKKIAENIIINDNAGYWDFRYNKKKSSGLIKKLEVFIDIQVKKSFINKLNNIENQIELLFENEIFKQFSEVLMKKINKEIKSRQDHSD